MDGFFSSEDGMEDGGRGRKNGGQRMAVVADAAVASMHLSTIHKERADFGGVVSLGIITLLQDQKFISLTSNPTMFLGYWNG